MTQLEYQNSCLARAEEYRRCAEVAFSTGIRLRSFEFLDLATAWLRLAERTIILAD